MELRDVTMDFAYGESFTESSPEAYERLILDVLLGTPTCSPSPGSGRVLEDPRPDRGVLGVARQACAVRIGQLGTRGSRRDARTRRTELAQAMKIDLTDTTASEINKALVRGRRAIGTPPWAWS